MKSRLCNLTARSLFLPILLALTSCSSSSTPPPPVGLATISYTKGVPGGVLLQTFKTTGTVTAIDRAKHNLTLIGSKGKEFVARVAPEAVNYEQLRVGDKVNATITQKILVSLDKESVASGIGADGATSAGARSDASSSTPAETIEMTGTILAIDPAKRTATLQFDDGTTDTFNVRDDIDLTQRKVGEHVLYRVKEMTAIWLEKP